MNRYFEIMYKQGDTVKFYFGMCAESNCINAAVMPFMDYTGDYDLRHYGILETKKSDWEYFKDRFQLVIDGNHCYWVNNIITEQNSFIAKYTVNDTKNRLASIENKTNEELTIDFYDIGKKIELLPRQRKFIENGTDGELLIQQFIGGNYTARVV